MRFRVLAAAGILASLPAIASATAILNIEEVGADVVATFSGTIDLTGTTVATSAGTPTSASYSSLDMFYVGAVTFGSFYQTGSLSGDMFRTDVDGYQVADSDTGDLIGVRGDWIVLPYDYSGTELSGSGTWTGMTVLAMGLNPGAYIFTLPNDMMTINVVGAGPSAVPLPAAAPLLLGALGFAGAALRKRRT